MSNLDAIKGHSSRKLEAEINGYRIFVETLPKPQSEEERLKLEAEKKPYIVSDTIRTDMHYACGSEVPTRILTINVPKAGIVLPLEYHHHGSEDVYVACKDEFRKNLASERYGDDEIENLADFFYREIPTTLKGTPQEQLEQAATIYKLAKNYEESARKISGLARMILDE